MDDTSNIVISPLYKVMNGKIYRLTFKFTMADTFQLSDLDKWLSDLEANGYLPTEPGLEPGEEKETIVTVMRRAKTKDNTPIIDFYPEWGAGTGDEPYGTYKFVHKYMNEDDEIAAFLAVMGLKSLEDIPLYDAQSPLKRTVGKPHPKEFKVAKPFVVVKRKGAEKIGSDGQPYHPWEFVRYEGVENAPKSNEKPSNSNAEQPAISSSTHAPDTGGNPVLGLISLVTVKPPEKGKKNPYLLCLVELDKETVEVKMGGREHFRAAFKGHVLLEEVNQWQTGSQAAFAPLLACHLEKDAAGNWVITNILPVPENTTIDIPF